MFLFFTVIPSYTLNILVDLNTYIFRDLKCVRLCTSYFNILDESIDHLINRPYETIFVM